MENGNQTRDLWDTLGAQCSANWYKKYHDHKNTVVSKVLYTTHSNRLDLAAQLANWTSIPKVVGSIETVVMQTFQPARYGYTLRVTTETR